MTAPLQLVARAGEEIVCPNCGAVVATFPVDAFGSTRWGLDFTEMAAADGSCRCGGVTAKSLRGHQGAIVDAIAAGDPTVMFIRSGSWQGWRALGGE